MLARLVLGAADDPVALQLLGVGVPGAEEGVGEGGVPDVAGVVGPGGDVFGALDDGVFAGGGGVGDAAGVAESAVAGGDPFAVGAVVDDHGVAGQGEGGGVVDGAEGGARGAGGGVERVWATQLANSAAPLRPRGSVTTTGAVSVPVVATWKVLMVWVTSRR